MANDVGSFDGWAVLELMGHRQRAGLVKDVEMFGTKMLRIDIPVNAETTITEFYGGSAVYALRPCSEDVVREHNKRATDPRPVKPIEFRPRASGDDSEYDSRLED